MVTLIIDDYKLQFLLFEKMGSRSIEGSTLGKVGMGGPEGYIDPNIFDGSEYDPKIKIRNINGGFEITGGIFDYRKYEGRLTEDYCDRRYKIEKKKLFKNHFHSSVKIKDRFWPEDYTQILVYRDSYKRLVSAYYWINNVYDNNFSTKYFDMKKYKDLIFPKKETITEHRRCFKNFCRLYYVDRKISDGHLSAIWEQIPENYLNQVDYKINLENFNDDVVKILKKLKVDKDKIGKFSKYLDENQFHFKNKKSTQTSYNLQRLTNDYYSYYARMPRKILNAINKFYEVDLNYTGIEKL
jgi:hypothetical protein